MFAPLGAVRFLLLFGLLGGNLQLLQLDRLLCVRVSLDLCCFYCPSHSLMMPRRKMRSR